MLNLNQCRLSQLAILVAEIEFNLFTGRVRCNSITGNCQLYFRQGALIHAQSANYDQHVIIYEMLNWKEGFLTLESAVEATVQNLLPDQVSLWREALRIFQLRGIFEKPLTPSSALLLAERPTWMTSVSTLSIGTTTLPEVVDTSFPVEPILADSSFKPLDTLPSELLHETVIWDKGLKLGLKTGTRQIVPNSTTELQPLETSDLEMAPISNLLPQTLENGSDTSRPTIPTSFAKINSSACTSYVVETNLLLPEGLLQTHLLELLAPLNFERHLIILQQLRFTGYVYYRLSESNKSEQGDYGLALFLEGCPTDLVYYEGDTETRQMGMQAYQTLNSFKQLKPEIYKVEARTLKAYRALINGEQPYKNVQINGAIFTNLLETFSQSQRDGVALLYVESLKLYYFFLFEGGTQVGIFGPDFQSGRLQELQPPLALPANNAGIMLTVMLAKPSDLSENPALEPNSVGSSFIFQAKTMELPSSGRGQEKLTTEPPAKVNWDGLFDRKQISNWAM
ncbi:MAG: hypothetical protein WCS37_05640 [Chloroflexota bacterium]